MYVLTTGEGESTRQLGVYRTDTEAQQAGIEYWKQHGNGVVISLFEADVVDFNGQPISPS
jgi:hypothetical protein